MISKDVWLMLCLGCILFATACSEVILGPALNFRERVDKPISDYKEACARGFVMTCVLLDQQEAKKWQERREALEALQKLVESPKIENGSFGTLVSAVMKV